MDDRICDEPELDEAMPPLAVLEAYTVPDLPFDFSDRVMASLQSAATAPPRPVRAPWIVAGVAMACAIAATVALVLTPQRDVTRSTAAVVAASTPAGPTAPPVSVAAPVAIATGDLVIDASPHDAIVRIDGVPVGESTGGSPFVRTNLPVGTHLVEIERDGYLPWHRSIDVPPRALQLKVELRPTEPAGPVEIITTEDPAAAASKTRRPRPPSKPSGSPDLKNPFGLSPPDLEDPFGDEARDDSKSKSSSADMKDPFGSY